MRDITGTEQSDDVLAEAIANAIQTHCSHDGGMSFDADELIVATVSNLAFHLALVPAFQTRAARKQIARRASAMLEGFMADAAKDPEIAVFRNATTAVSYDPGSVQ